MQWSWGLDSNHDRGAAAAEPGDAAGDGQPVRRHGRSAADAAGRAGRRGRVDRHRGADVDDHVAGQRRAACRRTPPSRSPGTAADTGGGVVGGVEVSVDGGATWRRATGRGELDVRRGRPARRERSRSAAVPSTTAATSNTPAAGMTVTVGAGTATCPCSIWAPSQSPTGARGQRCQRRRTRHAVPLRRRRLHHGDPLLQERAERRPARRQSVDRQRHAAGDGDVRRRDRVRLAGGDARHARSRSRANTTYVVSYHTNTGYLLRRRRLLRRRPASTMVRCTRRATATYGANGVYRYGAQRFPDRDLRERELLGRRRVRRRRLAPDTTPPTVSARHALGRRVGRRSNTDGHGDLQRSDERVDDHRRERSSCATPRNALVPATVIVLGADADRHAAAERRRSRTRRPTPRRVRGGSTGVKDTRRQCAGGRLHLVVHDRRRRRHRRRPSGPGGPILVDLARRRIRSAGTTRKSCAPRA